MTIWARAFFAKSLLDKVNVKTLRALAADSSRHDPSLASQLSKCLEKGEMQSLVFRQYCDLYIK